MKSVFLYTSPHNVHRAWAESINAIFIEDKIPQNALPNISRALKSFSTIRKLPKSADLLLCESSSNTLTGVLWKMKHPKTSIILIASDPKWGCLDKMPAIKRKFYYWMLSKYDLIIATSKMMKEKFPEKLQERIKIIQPFTDTKKFLAKKGNLNSKNIIYTGRISLEKGADLVLEAFKIIKKEVKEAKLYFIGISSQLPGQGDLRKILEKQIKEEQIKDVIFTGHINNPENYMEKCSILMSLARIDAANVSIAEAMCMGIIPIASQGVGFKDVAGSLSKELVVNNEKEAAFLVLKLWNSRQKMQALSKKAVKIGAYYNKENSVKAFKNAITTMIKP